MKKRPVASTALTTTTSLAGVQIEALKLSAQARAEGKRGFAFYMDMGLGKTLTALEEFCRFTLERPRHVTRLLVICPNSFKNGWKNEVHKHGFDFAVHVYDSRKRQQCLTWMQQSFGKPAVLIMNYEAIRVAKGQTRSNGLDTLKKFIYDKDVMLVIDESIAIKNPRASQTKTLLRMPLYMNFRAIRLLSGKPSTQGPHDYWAQLAIIDCVRESFFSFRNRYCKMGGYKDKEVLGALNPDELADRMRPFVFKALKDDPRWGLGLPPKLYTDRQYDLGPLLRPYQEMELEFLTWLRNNKGHVAVEAAITQLMKLQQIQCGFIHKENGDPERLVDDKDNPRLKALLEVIDNEVSGKVAICYHHRFVGRQLYDTLSSRGLDPVQIQGDMKQSEIDGVKDRFDRDPDCRAILLQIQAGKYGHTLLGDQGAPIDACATMIFYQNNFSFDDRSQIEDRIHRMGQKQKSCLYLDFVGSGTDMKIIAALQRKERLYNMVMGLV